MATVVGPTACTATRQSQVSPSRGPHGRCDMPVRVGDSASLDADVYVGMPTVRTSDRDSLDSIPSDHASVGSGPCHFRRVGRAPRTAACRADARCALKHCRGDLCTWKRPFVRWSTTLWEWVFECKRCHRQLVFTTTYSPRSRGLVNGINKLQEVRDSKIRTQANSAPCRPTLHR